jgi:hypothetical protein
MGQQRKAAATAAVQMPEFWQGQSANSFHAHSSRVAALYSHVAVPLVLLVLLLLLLLLLLLRLTALGIVSRTQICCRRFHAPAAAPAAAAAAAAAAAQADSTRASTKDLDVVLADESLVLILDDTEHVWQKHAANLIQVRTLGALIHVWWCESCGYCRCWPIRHQ